MAFTSNLGGIPVIDDSNYQQFVQLAANIGEFGSGYIPRNFQSTPFGSIVKKYSGPIFDRKELIERIKEKEALQSGLFAMFKKMKLPILNQGRLGYCWMYGTVMAMIMAYAKMGMVLHLSPTSCAAKGKNYANQGGLAEEALRYIKKFGVSTVNFWPDGGLADRRYDTPEQRANAELHKAVEFEELPSENPEAVASALVVDLPCTAGLGWWGHLVALAQPCVMPDGSIGFQFPNSWGTQFGKEGWGVLAGSKAVPFEAFCVRTVTPAQA